METDSEYEVYWAGKTMPFETLAEAMLYAQDMTLEECGNNRDIAYIRKRYHCFVKTTSVRWIEGAIWVIEDITQSERSETMLENLKGK